MSKHLPARCEVLEISGVSQSYSVGGSRDAPFAVSSTASAAVFHHDADAAKNAVLYNGDARQKNLLIIAANAQLIQTDSMQPKWAASTRPIMR